MERTNAAVSRYDVDPAVMPPGGLMERLSAIAGERGIDTTKRLTREQAHARKLLRKAGV